MFTPTVDALKEFYQSPLGHVACRALRRQIRLFWPREMARPEMGRDELILGLGFATPYLIPYLKPHGSKAASRAVSFMPGAQGATCWPTKKPCRVAMTSEHQLPLPDNSVQRILIVHALEHAENPRQFLREVWRVLDPAGSVLLIVPSRSGLWAHAEHTPFGHGRPYSESQLKTLLEDNMFTCRKARAALFLPPTQRRFLIKTADIWEGLGALVPFWGGVSLAAAEKTLYAAATTGSAPPPVFATAVE